jgi:hypothetical protein
LNEGDISIREGENDKEDEEMFQLTETADNNGGFIIEGQMIAKSFKCTKKFNGVIMVIKRLISWILALATFAVITPYDFNKGVVSQDKICYAADGDFRPLKVRITNLPEKGCNQNIRGYSSLMIDPDCNTFKSMYWNINLELRIALIIYLVVNSFNIMVLVI